MSGFDVHTMGFVAPAIVGAWHISPANLGPVFGAGLFGMLAGSIVLGAMADRVGRRPVLVGATVFYGLCMLGTTLIQNIPQFLVIRFMTGFGIGGVMGIASALVSEYGPRKRRASLMTWVSCGFTGGAIAGGLLSAALVPSEGWKSVFLVGGVLPLAIAVAMVSYLPESLQLLVLTRRDPEKVAQWLGRIAPNVQVGPRTSFVVHEQAQAKASVGELFRHGRGTMTLLLWGVNFANLLDLFFLSNWLPMLSLRVGAGASTAVLIGTSLQIGGTVGVDRGSGIGWPAHRAALVEYGAVFCGGSARIRGVSDARCPLARYGRRSNWQFVTDFESVICRKSERQVGDSRKSENSKQISRKI